MPGSRNFCQRGGGGGGGVQRYEYRVQSHARIQEFLAGGGVQARLSENSSFSLVLNIVIFQEVRTPYSHSGSAHESSSDPVGSEVDMKL